jgi:RimJ/RimL family protein N-acetyltransferase
MYLWVICLDGSKPDIDYVITDVYRKSAEIGYFIGERFWNKGITTKAVNLFTDSINQLLTKTLEVTRFMIQAMYKTEFLKIGLEILQQQLVQS